MTTMDDLPDRTDPRTRWAEFMNQIDGCGHPNHGNPDHDCKPFLPVEGLTEPRTEHGADDSDISCSSCEGPTNNPDCYCDKCALSDQAEEIDSLKARLAQAEADLADANRMVGALGSQGVDALERAKAAEAALARVKAAAEREHEFAKDAHRDDDFAAGRWATSSIVLAALVVADTGEGLSKTSAKPLVVADTPEQQTAHQEEAADLWSQPKVQVNTMDYRLSDALYRVRFERFGHMPHVGDVFQGIDEIEEVDEQMRVIEVDESTGLAYVQLADTPEQEQR